MRQLPYWEETNKAFLTPKLNHMFRRRRRNTIMIGSLGFLALMACGRAYLYIMLACFTICWDMFVVSIMATFWLLWAFYVWPVQGGMAIYRRHKQRQTVEA